MSAEKIVTTLKAAEKQVLLQHSPHLQSWGDKNDTKLPPWTIGRELRILALIDFASDRSSQTRLTPLGKQVRIILTHLKDRTNG